jgi:predicted RNase H-like HicB family nuclease
MKKIEAIIERASDGTYSAYCIHEMFSGMGDTAEKAKTDMMGLMKFCKETALENNQPYPDFLNEEFEVVYKFDTRSLLEYYAGVITPAALERLSGIHQKQLWGYLHGHSKPRKKQVEKIEKALHALGSELMSISL